MSHQRPLDDATVWHPPEGDAAALPPPWVPGVDVLAGTGDASVARTAFARPDVLPGTSDAFTAPHDVLAGTRDVYAVSPDVVAYDARLRASRPRTRPWAYWTGGVLIVGLVIAAAIVVVPRAAPIVSQQATKNRVLSSGYSSFTGPKGRTVQAGSPWGRPCAPVYLVLPDGAPPELAAALDQVVVEARRGGLNVAVPTGRGPYDPQEFLRPANPGETAVVVPLNLDTGPPPPLADGSPEKVWMGWNMQLAPDGLSEYLTTLRPTLFLRALDDPLTQRRSVRLVIAWTQGISGSSTQGTGLARHMHESADAFSSADLAAMRAMSGCD